MNGMKIEREFNAECPEGWSTSEENANGPINLTKKAGRYIREVEIPTNKNN